MAVESVSRIVATSMKDFDDAIQEGIKRAKKTLRNLRRADVVTQAIRLHPGDEQEYEVTLDITFILE